jgi:hypothetical protein
MDMQVIQSENAFNQARNELGQLSLIAFNPLSTIDVAGEILVNQYDFVNQTCEVTNFAIAEQLRSYREGLK